MSLTALATKVVLIQGLSMYINKCGTIECPLFRCNICDGINNHRNCYDYNSWELFSDEIKDEIISVQLGRVREILQENRQN